MTIEQLYYILSIRPLHKSVTLTCHSGFTSLRVNHSYDSAKLNTGICNTTIYNKLQIVIN